MGKPWVRWSVKWMDSLQGEGGVLPMFKTRRECRDFINQRYGYIRDREDLRRPPHNWKMPVPVRVQIVEVIS